MDTQQASSWKNSKAKTLKLELAIHRRILRFLNEAIEPEDLMYEKVAHHVHEGVPGEDDAEEERTIKPRKILDHHIAKEILEFRDQEHPLGFQHIRDVLKTTLFDRSHLDILHHHFSEMFFGSWSAFPQRIPRRGPGEYDGVIHAALLRTGRVLFITADETTLLWDPENTTPSTFEDPINQPHTMPEGYSQLCGHHVFLSDGQLLSVGGGGYGPNPLARWGYRFDPGGRTWARTSSSMSESKWYPTAVALGDGRVLVTCGNTHGEMDVYDEATDRFSPIASGDNKSFPSLYPGLHLLPNHVVFYSRTGWGTAGPGGGPFSGDDRSAFFGFTGADTGAWTDIASPPPSIPDRTKGMSVLLLGNTPPHVRVLALGGADPSTNNTYETIDAAGLSPAANWGPAAAFPDGQHRSLCSGVLLPDGHVFVCGGVQATNSACAMFDPHLNSWSPMAELPSVRDYHSVAMLLPSGKVMMAGWHNSSIEIFTPPYLLKGARPEISSAPAWVRYGQSFAIESPHAASIARVTLVRPMAVTHQTDSEQRVIELPFSRDPAQPNRLFPTAPDGGHPHSLAPPGFYLLFILNRAGVPSVASWIALVSPTRLIVLDRTPIAAHARNDDHMELWVVDAFGTVRGNWWNGNWHAWHTLHNPNTTFPQRAHLGVLGRHSDHMEAFGIGVDGRLHGIWWDGEWHDWFTLGAPAIPNLPPGTPALPPGAPLAVRSRSEDHMEVWVVGADRQVHGIWWDGDNWRDWFSLPGAFFPVGAPLAVHCRNDDHMEIWGIDEGGTLRGNWFNGSWQGWYSLPTPIGGFSLVPGGKLAVLGRNDDHMEVWCIGGDDRLHGIWWDGDWHDWYTLPGPFSFPPGGPLVAVSRDEDYMEVWAAGDDNRLHGVWFNGSWQPWYTLDQTPVPRSTPLAALSRNDDHMEVWCVTPDGPAPFAPGVHGVWWNGSWNPFYRLG